MSSNKILANAVDIAFDTRDALTFAKRVFDLERRAEKAEADLADYKRYFADAEKQIEQMGKDLEKAEDSLASERIRNALAGKGD